MDPNKLRNTPKSQHNINQVVLGSIQSELSRGRTNKALTNIPEHQNLHIKRPPIGLYANVEIEFGRISLPTFG